MSRQSEIRERLERVVGAYPDSDDVRYLLDRLEAADKVLTLIAAHGGKTLMLDTTDRDIQRAYTEGASTAFAQIGGIADQFLKESQLNQREHGPAGEIAFEAWVKSERANDEKRRKWAESQTPPDEHGGCNCAPVKGKHSIYCPFWVPEPVPTEGPMELLQRTSQLVGAIVVKDRDSMASQVEAMRIIRTLISEYAAPIAPAAEELIAELAAALRYVVKMREVKCEHKHPPPDNICARCLADVALARAEEYRKGAKK